MRILKYLLLFFTATIANAQEFEGILRYSIKFEPKKESLISKSKLNKYKLNQSDSAIMIYYKQGDFLKYNYAPKSINIYDSKSKLIYIIDKGDKEIVISKPHFKVSKKVKKPKLKIIDSLITINNIKCKKAYFDYGYYNDDEKHKGMGQCH